MSKNKWSESFWTRDITISPPHIPVSFQVLAPGTRDITGGSVPDNKQPHLGPQKVLYYFLKNIISEILLSL